MPDLSGARENRFLGGRLRNNKNWQIRLPVYSTLLILNFLTSACFFSTPFKPGNTELSSTTKKSDPTAVDYQAAHRRASLKFIKRSPPSEEVDQIQDMESYRVAIRAIVDDPQFVTTMKEYHQKFFNMSGTEGGINYDEPANLAAYLVRENADFRDILRATHCVNNDLASVPCSSFTGNAGMAATNAAGVVTTRAFLKKWDSPFNFVRTNEMLKAFGCHEYPDLADQGMTEQEVSGSVHTFNCVNCDPSCYSCHNNMNPRASLFYTFDFNGNFNLNPTNALATKRDTGDRSEISDLLVDGASPRFNGQMVSTLRDYALALAETPKFSRCLSRRMTLFSIGGETDAILPSEFGFVEQLLVDQNYRIKDFIFELLTRPEYVAH